MSPKNPSDTTVANGNDSQHKNGSAKKEVVSRDYLRDRHAVDKEWNCLDHILWVNVLYFVGMHVGTVLGLYLAFTSAKYLTLLFGNLAFEDLALEPSFNHFYSFTQLSSSTHCLSLE